MADCVVVVSAATAEQMRGDEEEEAEGEGVEEATGKGSFYTKDLAPKQVPAPQATMPEVPIF